MRTCACGCGKRLEGRPDKRYASEACSKRSRRSAAAGQVTPDAGATEPGRTVRAVRDELERAGRAETYLGAAALGLAQRIDESTAVMGYAALVKELRATMDAAMAGAEVVKSSLDELRARRDAKRSA